MGFCFCFFFFFVRQKSLHLISKKSRHIALPLAFRTGRLTGAFDFIQVKSEPSSSKTFDYFPYFAYAPNGTVKGDLVYINQGSLKDILYLKSHNISVEGKIVIVRGPFASVSKIH